MYYVCDFAREQTRAFLEKVPPGSGDEDRLRRALERYFQGAPGGAGERFFPFAGPRTYVTVSIEGGRAIVDLTLPDTLSAASSQATNAWKSLSAMAFQFAGVNRMEPRMNGSCAAFGNAMQADGCQVALRDGSLAAGP